MALWILAGLAAMLVIPAALFVRGPRAGEVEGSRTGGAANRTGQVDSLLDAPIDGWSVAEGEALVTAEETITFLTSRSFMSL